ncbi:putative AC transposase, partial [Bienertia sinuspersici]
MMEPKLWPDTLEMTMAWARKARRGAAVADKHNYTGMLLTCPTEAMLLSGSLMHVRCCAHILNLCVQEGLGELRPLLEPIRSVIRWIRVGRLLHNAIAYCDVLTEMFNESWTGGNSFITNDHWSLAMIIHDVLQTFDNATHIFSFVYEPNIHMVILECIESVYSIKKTFESNPTAHVKNVLDRMKVKWHNYFKESLGINYDVAYYVNYCKIILERLCELHGAVIQPELVGSTSKGKLRFGFLGPALKKQQPDSSSSSTTTTTTNVGVDEYLSYQFETEDDFHIIQWWKNHSLKFLVLARIAKGILAILAPTIAYESAFSAGRRVLDEKKSRLAPQSIEMCVCKKDWDQ